MFLGVSQHNILSEVSQRNILSVASQRNVLSVASQHRVLGLMYHLNFSDCCSFWVSLTVIVFEFLKLLQFLGLVSLLKISLLLGFLDCSGFFCVSQIVIDFGVSLTVVASGFLTLP